MKIAFTIATPNYISYAKTLGDSILKYNSDYVFYLCLIGEKKELESTVTIEKFNLIQVDELEDSAVTKMQIQYNLFELSCALKPYFASHLLKKNPSLTRLKYFDSDMLVFNSFNLSLEEDNSSVFLTPHFTNPVPLQEEGHPNDSTMLHAGIFNAGFFEVRNTKEALRFLAWWKNRLFEHCYALKPPYPYIFVDQSWLALVPIYFKEVCIIENTGYNMAFYNLQERRLSKHNNEYLVNGRDPLVFFHFTGYKYYNHQSGSALHTKHNYSNTVFLEEICTLYLQKLLSNQVELTSPQPLPIVAEPDIQDAHPASPNRVFSLINSVLGKVLNIRISKVN